MDKILIKQRDIILIPFPFSDQTGQKVRPALAISNDKFNQSSEDIVVCAITSNLKHSKYSLIISQEDIESGILYEKSLIKAETIFKIKSMLIIKRIAILNRTKFSEVISAIQELIKLS